ncbi:hypothetical protein GCM10023201_34710 [Actinomycetospora corticicola]|uniref:Luciferase-like monooxygenase n=1 Tax=Actinomycetospora corticicola TaxID=663602 RepID=A0A7Y9E0A6_9PSEU|nr:LLM class flavin-dependent oxidoreductase [Actinomycetospora corticicola]NYD38863.1 hypothetical protein [Actinomycetospora corticicola]
MTAVSVPTPVVVALDPVHHGLVDPVGGSRDLDAMLDEARAAERAGADAVLVPAASAGAPAPRHWPATAQALAVLLATTSVQVVVPIRARAWDVEAVARFAASATGLAGDRLVVRVLGVGATAFATRLRARWAGPVEVAASETVAA